jgi:hypothetical protein
MIGMMAGLYTLSASRRVYYSCIYKLGERERREKKKRGRSKLMIL